MRASNVVAPLFISSSQALRGKSTPKFTRAFIFINFHEKCMERLLKKRGKS